MSDKNQKIKVLTMIAEDIKSDAKEFEGRNFDGKTVAEYFGYQGAAIASLAKILKSELEGRITKHATDADKTRR